MVASPFHLGWFVQGGFRTPGWNGRWSGTSSRDWMYGDFYVDFARALERACFDCMMFADACYVGDAYGGTMEASLKYAHNAPKHDPTVLAPVLASATDRLGIVPTISTTEWLPFQVARWMSSADHVSRGRIGWNIVTSSNDQSAQNYGHDRQPPHDERYAMADEFVDIASKLWESWEPDALVMDRERGVYVDHEKVHLVNYEGRYFKSRGPLNTLPSPQRKPVILQAGSSPRGRQFASRWADLIIGGSPTTVEGMKQYREEVRATAESLGRKPDDIKIFFIVHPVLGESEEHAWERVRRRDAQSEAQFMTMLANWSRNFAVDLSRFDPDEPLPATLTTNGHQGVLSTAIESGKTLRQWIEGKDLEPTDELALVGTPEIVAAKMEEVMSEVGGDGFFVTSSLLDRRYIDEITDGLVPVLQERGLVRRSYGYRTFRENLLEY